MFSNPILRSRQPASLADSTMAEIPASLRAEIDRYERKYAENPDGRLFVPLAEAYRVAGELALAERLVRDGLVRYPDYVSARVVLGRTLADQGEGAEAAAEFERVLALDAHNLVALRTLAELALADGRPDEAAHWYHQLLAADPLNEDARAALDSLEEDGAYEEPTAPDPADGEELVSETLAELYARQGYSDRAADMYRQLIRQRGEEPGLLRRLREMETAGPAPVPAAEPVEVENSVEVTHDANKPFAEWVSGAEDEAEAMAGAAAASQPLEQLEASGAAPVPTIAEYLEAVLAWRPGGASGSQPDVSVTPEAPEPAADTVGEQPEDWTAGYGAEGPAPEDEPVFDRRQGVATDDDDDHESFQAWLRSLKR
jgi:tetratricopeptide (TPR) repeat protein